jgi:hypothetical protein
MKLHREKFLAAAMMLSAGQSLVACATQSVPAPAVERGASAAPAAETGVRPAPTAEGGGAVAPTAERGR